MISLHFDSWIKDKDNNRIYLKAKNIYIFNGNRLNFRSINNDYPHGLTSEHNIVCKYIGIIWKRKYFDFSKPSAAFLTTDNKNALLYLSRSFNLNIYHWWSLFGNNICQGFKRPHKLTYISLTPHFNTRLLIPMHKLLDLHFLRHHQTLNYSTTSPSYGLAFYICCKQTQTQILFYIPSPYSCQNTNMTDTACSGEPLYTRTQWPIFWHTAADHSSKWTVDMMNVDYCS